MSPQVSKFLGSDGKYHIEGSFLGTDGRYHTAGSFVGVNGEYVESENLREKEVRNQGNEVC
jgi:hypothetical protein